MNYKFNLYQENGLREYWIVQPEFESILVFALEGNPFRQVKMYAGDDKISSVIFPGLIIDLANIFGQ
jgi:Uma2 family endonuclease